MSFFEISPLCNYNIKESFAELSRIVLKRHGMDNYPWKNNSGKFDLIYKIQFLIINILSLHSSITSRDLL